VQALGSSGKKLKNIVSVKRWSIKMFLYLKI
jgi:hypothetical protein